VHVDQLVVGKACRKSNSLQEDCPQHQETGLEMKQHFVFACSISSCDGCLLRFVSSCTDLLWLYLASKKGRGNTVNALEANRDLAGLKANGLPPANRPPVLSFVPLQVVDSCSTLQATARNRIRPKALASKILALWTRNQKGAPVHEGQERAWLSLRKSASIKLLRLTSDEQSKLGAQLNSSVESFRRIEMFHAESDGRKDM